MDLSEGFPPVTAEDWRRQIEKDLKGTTFEQLIRENRDGISIQPFYTRGDLDSDYRPAFTHTACDACAYADGDDAAANAQLLAMLQHGASSLHLGVTGRDPAACLRQIDLGMIHASFGGTSADLPRWHHHITKEKKQGAFFVAINESDAFRSWTEYLLKNTDPGNSSVICADTTVHHNLSCTASYELALGLSAILEFFGSGIKQPPAAPVALRMGVDVNYFLGIAKFRAAHRLWALLRKEFGWTHDLRLTGVTSLADKSVTSAYNNLVRTSLEAMSAKLGGCHEVQVHTHDALRIVRDPNGPRLALNQLFLLSEEAHLGSVADVACGSYYIETLTDGIAARALAHMKEIDATGGFIKTLTSGIIERTVASQKEVRDAAVSSGSEVVIGVNKFAPKNAAVTLDEKEIRNLEKIAAQNAVADYELKHIVRHEKA